MMSCAISANAAGRKLASRLRRALLASSLGLLLALTGCNETSHGDRVPLSGTVTVAGQPLDVNATLSFDPETGQAGTGSMCEVKESKFTADAATGPTPGLKYKVTLVTVPGIPAEGTPRDQIKIAQRYTTTVEVPKRGATEAVLNIDFPAKGK